MGDILLPGQKMEMRSMAFNFLAVVNDSSFSLDITSMHNNIVAPILIIRNATKKEDTEEDRATKEQLKNLEGQTVR